MFTKILQYNLFANLDKAHAVYSVGYPEISRETSIFYNKELHRSDGVLSVKYV